MAVFKKTIKRGTNNHTECQTKFYYSLIADVKLNGVFFPLKEALNLSVTDCVEVVASVTIDTGSIHRGTSL
jgi:ribosome-associated toxin RatA of RatAB toxin-antitoxin module